ncbi:ubiquitin-protein ligase E3C-like [Babylonia areolata]|uniref:ubiquitin-protein ligase E3C-like n=1 Tax=Babylonia areolata TaxID=304850 RepID=UPI003FD615CE
MWSFEGEFRTKPTQSLGGASKKEQKDSLLKRAQEERQKREQVRIRDASAKKIQSIYRGYRERKKWNHMVQSEFDQELQDATKKGAVTPALLSKLLQRLCLFFRPQDDGQRLVSVSQQLLKQKDPYLSWIFKDPSQAILQIQKFLELHLRYLRSIVTSPTPIAVPMRMLELFISPAVYDPVTQHCGKTTDAIVCQLWKHLIAHGYFECMKEILNEKVPSSLERSPTPPTPVAASVLELIMSPVSFATATSDRAFSRQVLLAVCQTLLCPSFSEQVAQFLLPAMAYGKYPFPFVELIQTLITHTSHPPQEDVVKSPTSSSSQRVSSPTSSSASPSDTGLTSLPAASSADSLLSSPWLLLSVLMLGEKKVSHLDAVTGSAYLELLRLLIPHLPSPEQSRTSDDSDDDDDDDDNDKMVLGEEGGCVTVQQVREECIQLLDSAGHLKCLLTCLQGSAHLHNTHRFASICHHLLSHQYVPVHRLRLLYSLAFNTQFIRSLWQACTSVSMQTVTGSSSPLLMMLSNALPMTEEDTQRIVPLLSTFCSMFSYSLLTLHDADFYGDNNEGSSSMPFSLREMVAMSLALRNVCVGIIELAHPDSKLTASEDYRLALYKTGSRRKDDVEREKRETSMWAFLFKVIATVVRQIYSRDSRRPFCMHGHWLAPNISVESDKPLRIYDAPNGLFQRRPFADHKPLTKMNPGENQPPLTSREVRSLLILTELPFVVSFEDRVRILQRLIQGDLKDHQRDPWHDSVGGGLHLHIRRPYIYEDSFEKLSLTNAPDMKVKMRVRLVNAAGLDEAGIDGGGLFREFLSELLKEGFNPNRGFFKLTADGLLYPNPQASLLASDFQDHFFFLGRVLGKALLENMLVEMPFASFFLSKILSHRSANLDIHHLQSLDPVMYKNLLFLKNYEGDVSDLGLDFTVVTDDYGATKMVDLKPGGHQIAVTKDNRIEYIHLMADYFLNKQIRQHCNSFREGLADVIKLDWLQMFGSHELQVLISGAAIPIDINDLKRHANYSGGYTDSHAVIVMFWEVVSQFTDTQKSQLLKFVTSCSRPPLLGFRDLYPAFCIHHGGPDDRLPTASTCMNLLKLPEFKDEKTLRTKLLYAIESGAGFELS